jgi:hypothetical protein
MKKLMVAFAGLLAGVTYTYAQNSINIVTTAVPFLRISPDARSGGMGDMGIALSPDANSVFWNQAKIPFAKKSSQLALTYTPWLKDLGLNDVYLMSASGYKHLDVEQALFGSIRFFSLGNIQLTDFSGNILNNVRPAEFALDAGYARQINSNLGISVAMRYINSRLVTGDVGGVVYKAGNAVSGDIALYYQAAPEGGRGFAAGLTISNLGTKIGYTNDARNKDFIPANIGLGLSYTNEMDPSNKITFGLDINKLLVPAPPVATGNFSADSAALSDYRSQSVLSSWFKSFGGTSGGLNSLQVSAGMEYAYNEQFFARGGYFYEDDSRGNRKFFSLGAGFKTSFLTINLSYLVPSGSGVTRNPLSNTLRFGVMFDIGQDSK